MGVQSDTKHYSFDEFKMYYETTEKVTDWRLKVFELNLSLCVGIIVAIGVAWSWTYANPAYAYAVDALTAIVALLAILFSTLWISQVRVYKILNQAKFEVLEEMAPRILFESSNPSADIISAKPFEVEWKKVNEMSGRQSRGLFGVKGLRSSTWEFFVPLAFRLVFVAVVVASLLPVGLHWTQSLHEWQRFLGL